MVAIGFPTNGVTRLDSLIACARSHPAAALIVVLAAHLLVWTAIPILLGQGPPLDLVEGLALGKEWQLGYWKHPPLPWWVDEFTYQLTGTPRSVFLLGPLSAVICMYFVWRLAREVMEATGALIAAISLEGIHFFNHSAVEFNHNVLQLPLWAGAFWVFYRALVAAGSTNWMLAGACLGFAFWTKYSAVVLAATLVLVLLVDPIGRKSLRTPGPYLMALITLLVIAPHLTWLGGKRVSTLGLCRPARHYRNAVASVFVLPVAICTYAIIVSPSGADPARHLPWKLAHEGVAPGFLASLCDDCRFWPFCHDDDHCDAFRTRIASDVGVSFLELSTSRPCNVPQPCRRHAALAPIHCRVPGAVRSCSHSSSSSAIDTTAYPRYLAPERLSRARTG